MTVTAKKDGVLFFVDLEPANHEETTREEEYKARPWWVVNAHTEEFIAGARTEEDAKSSTSALNRAAHGAGTLERYRTMERPPTVEDANEGHLGLTRPGDVPPDGGF